ncbi:MAG: hypothetical protein II851_05245 [Bacteroidales bacterium]|nr:hypothetical protein [Bacteroidales bacterium]
MKPLKYIAAGLAAIMLLSSCSVIKNLTSNATSTGSNTGGALAALYQIFKATGALDLSNLTNIINLGKVLTGASALADATEAFTTDFTSGLIEGSSKLINDSNVQSVMTALKALSNVDATAISQAADAAAKGTVTSLNSATAGVAPTLAQLTSIFKAMQ